MDLSLRARCRVRDAKREARSELNEKGAWRRMKYANTFHVDIGEVSSRDNLERIDARMVPENDFIERFEKDYLPVVITHAQDDWPALHKWNIQKLAKVYRNQSFKCGEDDNGDPVMMKMKYFVEYMHFNNDDSPLYIFDSMFEENPKIKKLLYDYIVPKYFQDDIFQFASDHRRPPFRYFVMGPARSGTGVHIDPLGTSAWNALVFGHKWWCLFPPSCPKQLLKLKPGEGWKNRGEAVTWFNVVYPRTKETSWPKEFTPVEILQKPGEIVFVPAGWWHVVVNIDNTIAVTQTFCSVTNFPIVWYKTVKSRPNLSKAWYARLKICRPDLARVAELVDVKKKTFIQLDASSSSSSSDSDTDSSFDEDQVCDFSIEDDFEAECLDEGRNKEKKVNIPNRKSLTWEHISGIPAYIHKSPPKEDFKKIEETLNVKEQIPWTCSKMTLQKKESSFKAFVLAYKECYKEDFYCPQKIIPRLKFISFRAHEHGHINLDIGNYKREANQFLAVLRLYLSFQQLPDNFMQDVYVPWKFNESLGIKAGTILVNESGHVLVVKGTGKWGYPKGGIELYDQDPLEAAMRELEEEVGLTYKRSDMLNQNFVYLKDDDQDMYFFVLKCTTTNVIENIKLGQFEISEFG